MVDNGRMDDGTPFVVIGADEPESEEFIVHCECTNCGKQHYFNFWDMFACKPITCEHCGNVSVVTKHRLNNDTGEWEEVTE